MKNVLASSALAIMSISASSAPAQTLNGYCLDTVYAGCMPRFIPFSEMSIGFCEESCTLTDPVGVRGLNAVLFNLSCSADYDTPLDGDRVMILYQQNQDAGTNISWIDEGGITEIVPCP